MLSRLPPGTVDAFVNIYSFMEMGRAQIEEYFRSIDKLAPKIVYLKQHKREVNIYDRALNTSNNYPDHAWQFGSRSATAPSTPVRARLPRQISPPPRPN